MRSPYDTGRFAEVDDVDQVATRADVAAIVEQMLADLRAHPDEWENRTLPDFLEALAASLTDLTGLYANRGQPPPEHPTWRLLAEVLVMASGYE